MKLLFSGRLRRIGSGSRPAALAPPASPAVDPFAGSAARILRALPAGRLQDPMEKAVGRIIADERRASLASPPDRAAVAAFERELTSLLARILRAVEAHTTDEPGLTFEVAMIGLVDRPGRFLTELIGKVLAWSSEDDEARPGSALARALKEILLNVSRLDEAAARERPFRLTWPEGEKGSGEELTRRFLAGTPLADLLLARVPLRIPDSKLFEHLWAVAPPGWGKTQATEHMLMQLLDRRRLPSIVVLDSIGETGDRLSHLKCFAPGGRHAGRLIVLDPRAERPVAINPFRLRGKETGDRVARAMSENAAVSLVSYILDGILSSSMTGKQSTLLTFLARLLLSIPGASLETLIDVLEAPERFAGDIARLDGSTRRFLESQLYSSEFSKTRREIARRIWSLLAEPGLSVMLSAKEARLDLFAELQAGKLIILKSDRELLKDGSMILGRAFFAMVLQALLERSTLPRERRTPTFVVIDECHEILDVSVSDFIVLARKMSASLLALHQDLEQLPPGFKRRVLGNVATKIAGPVGDHDARDLAADLHTTPEAFRRLRQGSRAAEFLIHVRSQTATAVTARVPFFAMRDAARMSEAEHRKVMADIAVRYGSPLAAPAPAPIVTDPNNDDDDWRS
jgi:hypothetical protein